jgi:beta-glucosidase-like glycosyl hydrolase
MMHDDESNMLTPDIKFHLVRKIEIHKIIALAGLALLPHEEKFLEFHKSAGVILFERNVDDLSQLAELVESVKERLRIDGLDPLIMADHEGDLVSVLHRVIGVPPAPLAIAAAGDLDLARSVARATGEMMLKLGINSVLAPSADCIFDLTSPITGLRSFGYDPERVADCVRETIAGFQEAGVLTCAKHFPGHGSTREDSHETLPVVEKTLEKLRAEDILPFASAVKQGTEMIMTAHIAYRTGGGLDDAKPASFAREMIQGVLRGELGFDGVVITDALEMAGARIYAQSNYGGIAGGLERPLLAGSDLLLYSKPVPEELFLEGESMMSLQVMETIIHTLERVVNRERIEKKLEQAAEAHEGVRALLSILNESERRIRRLRESATARAVPLREQDEQAVIQLSDYPSIPTIYRAVAEKGIVLLRDPARFLPVEPDTSCVLVPIVHRPQGMIGGQRVDDFIAVLMKHFTAWRRTAEVNGFEDSDGTGSYLPLFTQPASARRLDLLTKLPEDASRMILLVSMRGAPPVEFMEGVSAFINAHPCPLVLVTGWPLTAWIPEDTGALLTLGSSKQVASATASILAGKREAVGLIERIMPPPERA